MVGKTGWYYSRRTDEMIRCVRGVKVEWWASGALRQYLAAPMGWRVQGDWIVFGLDPDWPRGLFHAP